MKNNQLSLHALDLKEKAVCQYVEQVYLDSFPPEERRDVVDFWALTQDEEKPFFIRIIWDASDPIGFISYWALDGFIYIEHFAFAEHARGKGAGTFTMQALYDTLEKPLILEVEPISNEQTQRRVNFYRRLGFHLWDDIDYLQPPYRPTDSSFALQLMTKGDLDLHTDLTRVVSSIYQIAYGVNENDEILKKL